MAGGLPSLAVITGGQPGPNPLTFRGLTLNSIDNPKELVIGTGEHKMAVSLPVGGGKIVHTLGFYPDTNTWGGTLHQPGVEDNIAVMTGWMVDGKEGLLTWKGQQFYGIVRKFTPKRYRGGNVADWTLEVEITRAANGAFSIPTSPSQIDSNVAMLLSTISTANDTIQGAFPATTGTQTPAQQAAAAFNTSVNTMTSAIAAATPAASAAASAIAAAQTAVTNTQATVPAMLSAFDQGSAPYIAAEQINTALSVVNANLGSVQSQNVIEQQGGSLFALASQVYGDPSQAYAIMSANGFTSTMLSGSAPTKIILPPLPGVTNDGSGPVNTDGSYGRTTVTFPN